ncbi:hypothetical protein EW146_g8536 [Bondarzewia mesenterica]|uniref:cellulase n=1 Tax=Bondarzewia mesenterica TaxID=1095465 RepID=A0A4S4LDL9_9AGAM|nr:hypothetical protein EW146_g8536 [Bondarzewia mesenterica]
MLLSALLTLASLAKPILSQVALPQPPWLPPNSSSGVGPSSGNTTPNPQWSTLLGNLLYFYEAQRSGRLPSTKRVSWRNDSAVNDGQDVNLDLSGGYYDAGDYIKTTFPLSFTIMSICWGANDFGRGYDMANQTAYLDDMLRWGLNWLIEAHPSPSTLFVQVANADLDNAYWGGDLNIPTNRPSYQINDTSSTPLRRTPQAANRSTKRPYPRSARPTPSSSYGDELAMAALILAWATNSSDLYAQAGAYYAQYKLGGQDAVFNWDSKTPGLAVLFAQLALAEPGLAGNLSGWRQEAESYFDRIVNGTGPSYTTSGGLLWYNGDSDDASLNPALNAAMLLTRYAQIATTSERRTSYLNFAQNQLDYALGKNPMSAPYVVGSNPNSPSNPHSAMASGGNDINQLDTSPAQEAYVLYGAVVGGPNKQDRFFNIRSDWPETEVALDYNAPLLTLAAAHALTDTADPYFTQLQAGAYDAHKPSGIPCDPAFPCGHSGLSTGAKVAIGVVVSVVGLFIIVLSAYLVRRMGRRRGLKA